LAASIKYPDDTPFHCYRAVEALRIHCAASQKLTVSKAEEWAAFRTASASTETELKWLKDAADPLRHGDLTEMSGESRAEVFKKTWEIVDRYLAGIAGHAAQ
jgi:hypothetical protein